MTVESTKLRPASLVLLAVLLTTHAWFTVGSQLFQTSHLDVYAQLPWMHRWSDPGEFPNDLVMNYFQQFHLPAGMRASYYVLNQWFGCDLTLANRILTVIWYVVAMTLYVAVVRTATRKRSWMVTIAALALTLIPFHLPRLVLFNPMSFHFLCGLSRAAGPAVLFLAMYGVVKPNRTASALAIVFGAAFYPPSCVIATALFGMPTLYSISLGRSMRDALYLVLGFIGALMMVGVGYGLMRSGEYGPNVSRADIAWAPEIVHQHFPYGQSLAATLLGWLRMSWFAFAAVIVQAKVCGRSRLLRANILMLLAGVIATTAAYMLWPYLYDIDRYQMLPRNIVTMLAIPAIVAVVIEKIAARTSKLPLTRLAVIAVIAYLSANLSLVAYRMIRPSPLTADRQSMARFQQMVIDFLRDSPKDTRLAAAGEDLDPIPMHAQRPLLLISPALFPYHQIFHREMIDRYLAIQAAVYATDWAAVRELRDRFGVRYLSVDRRRFEPEKFSDRVGSFVTRTWLPERIKPIQEKGPNHPYLFRDAPREMIVAEDGNYQLIDLSKIP